MPELSTFSLILAGAFLLAHDRKRTSVLLLVLSFLSLGVHVFCPEVSRILCPYAQLTWRLLLLVYVVAVFSANKKPKPRKPRNGNSTVRKGGYHNAD